MTDFKAIKKLVVKIVQTNNTHLFGILYDRHAPKVFNKCLGLLGNRTEAEDLTHDIFVHLFTKLRTFNGDSKFTTWLYTLTYNYCINYLQRDPNRKNKNEALGGEVIDFQDDMVSDAQIYQLKTDKLEKSLQIINPTDKLILMMKYQDDLSIKEIMQVFKITESAAKMRINRAKIKLIEIYNGLA
jgi:RNA polymerase sigma-70 factor (ECF subfamily)